MNNLLLRYLFVITSLLFTTLFSTANADEETTKLKHKISQGSGDINLLLAQGNKSISPLVLEALRLQNNGLLMLGVDINEASSGSEKSTSQGVAIEHLTLTVIIDEDTYTFTDFSTKTQCSLAKINSENRQFYYTLLGRTGSNSIAGSNLDGTSFDDTLKIPVNIDLSTAQSIHLDIQFLETNQSLGDPEEFYDYSAGFEDLALLTATDVDFLDTQAAGREDAPLVVLTNNPTEVASRVYYPSSTSYYLVGYEDQYPQLGDYDFNDLVVAYRVNFGLNDEFKVVTVSAEGYLIARGGSYDHSWHLRIPLPEGSQADGTFQLYIPPGSSSGSELIQYIDTSSGLDVTLFNNTTSLFFDPASPFTNTIWDAEHILGHKFSFEISLSNPVTLAAMDEAPFDPYLFVHNTNLEIHLEGKSAVLAESDNISRGLTSFSDENGYPFALVFPEEWKFPNEYVDIGAAYPELLEYIQSNRQSKVDWYQNGVASGITRHKKSDWEW
ncbi:MAG: LruC domain-containing protein [Colwellia sp.]|nr:LruC domain-containing protein [Colwellia sp.]